jgi:arylsulfatase
VGFGVITEMSTGFPGYDSVIGPENATVGEIMKQNGFATSWFGKNHNTPSFQYSVAGPFDQWPVGMGFEYFYGFMGGETDQWTPYLFRTPPRSSRGSVSPATTSSPLWRTKPLST